MDFFNFVLFDIHWTSWIYWLCLLSKRGVFSHYFFEFFGFFFQHCSFFPSPSRTPMMWMLIFQSFVTVLQVPEALFFFLSFYFKSIFSFLLRLDMSISLFSNALILSSILLMNPSIQWPFNLMYCVFPFWSFHLVLLYIYVSLLRCFNSLLGFIFYFESSIFIINHSSIFIMTTLKSLSHYFHICYPISVLYWLSVCHLV